MKLEGFAGVELPGGAGLKSEEVWVLQQPRARVQVVSLGDTEVGSSIFFLGRHEKKFPQLSWGRNNIPKYRYHQGPTCLADEFYLGYLYGWEVTNNSRKDSKKAAPRRSSPAWMTAHRYLQAWSTLHSLCHFSTSGACPFRVTHWSKPLSSSSASLSSRMLAWTLLLLVAGLVSDASACLSIFLAGWLT